MKALNTEISTVVSLPPIGNRTADDTGAQVDLADYSGAAFLVTRGTWTDGTHTFVFEEADDDGTGSPDTWAAIADADLKGTEPEITDDSGADTVDEIGYMGDARFVRVTTTTSGTTTGAEYAAYVLRGIPRHAPAT